MKHPHILASHIARSTHTHTHQLHRKYLKKPLWTATEQYEPEVRTDLDILDRIKLGLQRKPFPKRKVAEGRWVNLPSRESD